MPERPEWLERSRILTYEEMTRLASIAVRHGVRSVRVTGGEPLVRQDVPDLVRMLKAIPGLEEVTLTTNAMFLRRDAEALRDAGLDRINVSLDTLRPDRFEQLARRPGLEETLDGMAAAEEAGFGPLKVNCVAMRGINDDEILDFARWGRDTGRDVRWIEFMPLEGDSIWSEASVIPLQEIVDTIRDAYPCEEVNQGSNPAREFVYSDGGGRFGVIASVTQAFCGQCDRVRITADGGFRTCLFSTSATDLKEPIRSGATDDALADLMAGAVMRKWAGHSIGDDAFERPDRAMNAIGG
jgi:cyclic pyranopterin phosphate synthase